MKKIIDSLDAAYEQCSDGKLILSEGIDRKLASSLLLQSKQEWQKVKMMEQLWKSDKEDYSLLFCNHYDVMRKLLHALAVVHGVKPADHKCVSVYLCKIHPEYELNWTILETMRWLRNKAQYWGASISQEVWTSHKVMFHVYIKSVCSFIKQHLEEASKPN